MRQDSKDELISKREIGTKDFELLSTNGVLGLYEECELTHVFLLESGKNIHHHYFAIISYEEFKEVDSTLQNINLTSKLVPINSRFKLGISKKRISKLESEDIFEQLCVKKLNFHSTDFIIPEDVQLLPKTHIPSIWGYDSVMLNKILKPTLWGDNYILEFTAMNNPMNAIFNSQELSKINTEIKKVIPVDLSVIYDRIGSFIFQFPVTLVSGDAIISEDWTKAKISMGVHAGFKHKDDLFSLVTTKMGDVTTGHGSYQGYFVSEELVIGDSNNLEFKIFNQKNGLIYKNSMGNFLRSFNFNMGINGQNSEPRIFKDSTGNIHKISLTSYTDDGITKKSVNYDTRTQKRIIQNEIINKSGRFLSLHKNERTKALEFIRQQLNNKASSCSEIWLWDPFLSQADIFDTLYFVNTKNIKMKCITSFKRKKKRKDEKVDSIVSFIKREKNKFLENSNNNLGVQLEYRVAHSKYGFDFHDRFLFLIPKDADEMPTVFSLGTSINSLGKSHHLIQQAPDPRNIIETFNELWELLDNDKCLIIKLPEDNHDR